MIKENTEQSISYLFERGKKMEIFTLLETLEDLMERSRSVPFTEKGIVNKEEILEIIKEIRLKLPDELKQAKWVKEERGRILEEAQHEADGIVKEAENRIIAMIDEHEITKNANEMSREISKGTKDYADSILANLESAINDVSVTLNEAIKTIENNRKELKQLKEVRSLNGSQKIQGFLKIPDFFYGINIQMT